MKKKITLVLLFSFAISFAQMPVRLDYQAEAKKGTLTFFQIVEQKQKEFKDLDLTVRKNLKEFKHFSRWFAFWKDRVDANGNFPSSNLGLFNAKVLNDSGKINFTTTSRKSNSANENWTNVGPQGLPEPNGYSNPPQMGRLNCLLRIKHPTDRNLDVLFVGAPNGGIWKSTDGGANWTPKLDNLAGIGVTDIKTTPDATFANYTSKPIYVSTGDYDGRNANSIGVLKSTDGGETFSSTGLSYTIDQQENLGQLIVKDENTVLVGATWDIMRTIDGGANWSVAYSPGYNGNYGRVAINGDKAMFTGYYDIIYTSDYVTGNWTQVKTNGGNFGKHAVTVGEDGKFYIQGANGQIEQFDDTNSTFSNFGSATTGYDAQQGFNQTLLVMNNLVLVGGVNGNTSTNGASSWYNALNGYWNDNTSDGNYVHSDHHMMGKLDGTYEFWSTNDGGLNYVDFGNDPSNQKPTVTYKSEKVIVTQSYSVAINPNANDDAYLIANQDNDSFSKIGGTWYSVAMGDGIQSAINYNNSSIRYTANQNGFLVQSDTGFQGQLQGNGKSVSVPGAYFVFPLEMHKTNPDILYAGGDEVYKIEDGANLSMTNLNSGAGVASKNSAIYDIATHGNAIFVSGENGLRFSTDGGANWTTPAGAVTGTINSVDFDAANANNMYVTVSGYTNGSKVFKSTDGGASFTNISGDLPNIVMKEVLLKQGQGTEYLFVATELGVYFTRNGGTNWTRYGNGMPMVDVRDIEIHYTNDKLVAATFGRGLWEINIANTVLSTESLENNLNVSVFPVPSSQLLNISVANPGKYNYQIYNVVGGLVQKGSFHQGGKIDISKLATQTYILRVFDSKSSFSTRIIKN